MTWITSARFGVVTAIILWITRYLERAVATLRQTENVPDPLLAHLFPLGGEHINLAGDYIWIAPQEALENHDGLRPLRTPPEAKEQRTQQCEATGRSDNGASGGR